MNVQGEINRIKGNVESAFTAVEEKGGTLPETQTSGTLPEAIRSIPEGPAYAAGDGLSKEGATLSVTTPVRGIVTQAEFDALPQEQRNKGLYVISDGGEGGGGSGGETYSTEETRIGTWIDGKPLYRMVMRGTPLTNDPRFTIGQIQNVEHVAFMYGSAIYSSGAVIPVPYSSLNTYIVPEFNGDRDITLSGSGLSRSVQYILAVEYTKADEGGTA